MPCEFALLSHRAGTLVEYKINNGEFTNIRAQLILRSLHTFLYIRVS